MDHPCGLKKSVMKNEICLVSTHQKSDSTIAKQTKYGLRIKLNGGKSIKSQLHRK